MVVENVHSETSEIRDTLKEDKPPNKGQVLLYIHSMENHL